MVSAMKTLATVLALLVAAASPTPALSLETVPVAPDIFALVGPMTQRSAANLGNNATFGAVVTADGVVLIDSGGSAKGAAEIEAAVAALTDKPITLVINTGGQDHRWFGNAYFKSKGAEIVAASAAVADQKARSDLQWQVMTALTGKETLDGTELVYAETTFDETLTIERGGVTFELIFAGQAHTPGDAFVWLPEDRIAFTGDIVFMDRLLGVLDVSNSKSWLGAFAALEEKDPAVVVPGHGRPGTLAKARAETRDYLRHLRAEVGALLDAGGTLIDAKGVDQSAFRHLAVFDQISRRNAQAVFTEMEFE